MTLQALGRYGARTIIVFALCCLTACGFKLRGMGDVPTWLNNVSIVVQNGHKDLASLLKDQLHARRIRINPDPAKADYLLIIEQDSLQQKITNVSASTTPRQYQLLYTLTWSLVTTHGKSKALAPSQLVAVTRQLTVNNNRILGSDSEEVMITRAMRQDAVMQILDRLAHHAAQTNRV